MKQKDLPNFAAWSNKNLADFCTEAYIRMQEQQEEIADASRKHVDGVQRKQLDFIKRMSFDKEIPSTSRAAVRLQKKQKPNPKKPFLNLQHDGSSCSEDGTS